MYSLGLLEIDSASNKIYHTLRLSVDLAQGCTGLCFGGRLEIMIFFLPMCIKHQKSLLLTTRPFKVVISPLLNLVH